MKNCFLLFFLLFGTHVWFYDQNHPCLVESATLQNPLQNYISSCYNAHNNTRPKDSYCDFAVWGAGALYSNDQSFTTYEPGKPITLAEQDQVAQLYTAYLLSLKSHPSSNCEVAISWLSCTTVFPYCPIRANRFSGTSYFPPCRLHCDQVNSLCGIGLDCSTYKTTNCGLYIPDSYVLLPPSKGPYSRLSIIYACLGSIWVVSAIFWLGICFSVKNQPNTALLKLLTSIYFTRVGLCVTLCLFWIDCNKIEYYCTTSSTSNSYSALRLLESYQFFVLFLLARGWMVTRVTLTVTEWLFVYFSTVAYLVCSFTLVDVLASAPSTKWITYTTIIYFILYSQILFNGWIEIQKLRNQLIRLNIMGILQELYQSISLKYSMYIILLSFFIILVIIEIICELLFIHDIPIEILALSFEITSWLIIIGISYTFRPRNYSPFFFMVPVPSETNSATRVNPELLTPDQSFLQHNHNIRLPPLVMVQNPLAGHGANEGTHYDDDVNRVELELAPLLRNATAESSLVVMNKEGGGIELGVHSRDLTHQEEIVI